MKLYENGEVRQLNEETQEYELVGRHTVDLDGLFMLTDELGKYASFDSKRYPKEVRLFTDVEKQAGFVLSQLYKFQYKSTKGEYWFVETFGPAIGRHLYRKYVTECAWDVCKFYGLLDLENQRIFIKALVRL